MSIDEMIIAALVAKLGGKVTITAMDMIVYDRPTMRMVRRYPEFLDRNERAMEATVTLPLSLWSTPALKATITIPPGQAPTEFRIDAVAAADALKQAIGCDVQLVVHGPEPEA